MPGGPRGAALIDAWRLALGTLTVFPTKPPRTVDPGVGAQAMTLAPLVGALLAAVTGGSLWLLETVSSPPLLVAVLTLGLLAVLTRAIHLDGLADTADGLGSAKPAHVALEIMRKSDVGPFGVVTLVLVLLVQVAALTELVAQGRGPVSLAVGLVVSRSLLPLLCSKVVPAARQDGLGQVVAGSVSRSQLLVAALISVLLLVTLMFADSSLGETILAPEAIVRVVCGAVSGVLVGSALGWWCVRRLDGTTGDVLGAVVETAFTVALVVLTLL